MNRRVFGGFHSGVTLTCDDEPRRHSTPVLGELFPWRRLCGVFNFSKGPRRMKGRFYRLVRDLHLYFGLFIGPFVLVFAISVFFLVHSWRPRIGSETSTTRVVSAWPLPGDLQTLSGRQLIDALTPVLA